MTIRLRHPPCVAALVLALAFAPPLLAQGYSYDLKTTSTRDDPRGGAAVTRTFMAAHGQFANGSSRLDITESMAPGGMMGTGTYMISNGAKGTTTFVDPAKKQYMELNPAEMAKQAAGLQQALGGLSKTEILDLHIDMEDLGAGEKIEGYATLKYRLTESYTMKITVMGRANQTTQHSVSEIWVAPQLDGIMNPSARPAAAGAAIGPMAELMEKTAKAYAKVKPGAMLKTIHTSTSGEGAKAKATVMTMTVANLKREAIGPGVFQTPAGYTKVDSPFDALKPK